MVRRASWRKKRANSPSQEALSPQRRAPRCLKDSNLPELIGLASGPRSGGGLRPILFHRRTDHRKSRNIVTRGFGTVSHSRRHRQDFLTQRFTCSDASYQLIVRSTLALILLNQSIEHDVESSRKIKANLLQIGVLLTKKGLARCLAEFSRSGTWIEARSVACLGGPHPRVSLGSSGDDQAAGTVVAKPICTRSSMCALGEPRIAAGGLLSNTFVNVPAIRALHSRFDDVLGHVRRLRPRV
jgi:hypothetical protein